MAHVARQYRVMTVEEAVERISADTLPRNTIAITFDDGYKDNLTHAAPILARHGLPATIFLAAGFISAGEFPWYDRLALAFKLTRTKAVTLRDGRLVSLATQSDRLHALAVMLDHLKRVPDGRRREKVESLLDRLDVKDRHHLKDLMLSWDDVHALTGLGFSIGAHTIHHPVLSRVTLGHAEKEIMGSKVMIETALGRTVKAFAYPNGGPDDYTDSVARLVRQTGFTCAVTTRFGMNTRETSPYELRRGGPWEHHLPTFALKLAWYRLARA